MSTTKDFRRIVRKHHGPIFVGTCCEGSMVWFRSSKAAVLEAISDHDGKSECVLECGFSDNGVLFVDGKLS